MSPTKAYSTCAIYMDDGSGSSTLNPFSLHEYEEQCGAKSKQHSVTNVCVVGATPTSHMPDHTRKSVDAACLQNGRYVLGDACVAALKKSPDYVSFERAPLDPLFEQAQMCRTKLNGDFKTMCSGREITYDSLRSAVGADCEQCCETVLKAHDTSKKVQHGAQVKHVDANAEHKGEKSGHNMPFYIPYSM